MGVGVPTLVPTAGAPTVGAPAPRAMPAPRATEATAQRRPKAAGACAMLALRSAASSTVHRGWRTLSWPRQAAAPASLRPSSSVLWWRRCIPMDASAAPRVGRRAEEEEEAAAAAAAAAEEEEQYKQQQQQQHQLSYPIDDTVSTGHQRLRKRAWR